MIKIYATGTKVRDQMLIGKTWKMYNDGKTPEEIALDIKQSIERVNNCIEYCKKAYK